MRATLLSPLESDAPLWENPGKNKIVITPNVTHLDSHFSGGRVYSNGGNRDVTALLDATCRKILDVGCGAGDNARIIKKIHPACSVSGVTYSPGEAAIAKNHMEECWIFDIEGDIPDAMAGEAYDTIMFSHVLEHMRNPASVLARFTRLLAPGGTVLIAVPNILFWRQRLQFLFGNFRYESAGAMDDTHLRFFTYFTADEYLLAQASDLRVLYKGVSGSFPLWVLRRFLLPVAWCKRVDDWFARCWPNLFGGQVLIKARKESEHRGDQPTS